MGGVPFRPWLASLRVSGVSVSNDNAAEAGTLLSLDHADVGIRLESLWRRQLVLAVILTRLDVTTSSTGGGGSGLAALALPSTFSIGSVAVRVGRIRLDQGHVLYREQAGKWAVEVRGIEAEGWPEAQGLQVSARAGTLRVEWPTGEERLEGLRVDSVELR